PGLESGAASRLILISSKKEFFLDDIRSSEFTASFRTGRFSERSDCCFSAHVHGARRLLHSRLASRADRSGRGVAGGVGSLAAFPSLARGIGAMRLISRHSYG